MLQWTWHKTHVAIQLQLQLLLVPKKPHRENFNDMVRLDIHCIQVCENWLRERFCENIRLTARVRTFCVDSENIEIS